MTARVRLLRRVLGGVVRLDQVAAGRAGHEGVVERADHVDRERPRLRDADVQRAEQHVPAEAGEQVAQRQDEDRPEQVVPVGLPDHADQPDLDERQGDGELVAPCHRQLGDVDDDAVAGGGVLDEHFGHRPPARGLHRQQRPPLRPRARRRAAQVDVFAVRPDPDLVARDLLDDVGRVALTDDAVNGLFLVRVVEDERVLGEVGALARTVTRSRNVMLHSTQPMPTMAMPHRIENFSQCLVRGLILARWSFPASRGPEVHRLYRFRRGNDSRAGRCDNPSCARVMTRCRAPSGARGCGRRSARPTPDPSGPRGPRRLAPRTRRSRRGTGRSCPPRRPCRRRWCRGL